MISKGYNNFEFDFRELFDIILLKKFPKGDDIDGR